MERRDNYCQLQCADTQDRRELTRDGATRGTTGDEMRDLAAGLRPDLRPERIKVRLRISFVVVLANVEPTRIFICHAVGNVHIVVGMALRAARRRHLQRDWGYGLPKKTCSRVESNNKTTTTTTTAAA